jgi:hypothetical protein
MTTCRNFNVAPTLAQTTHGLDDLLPHPRFDVRCARVAIARSIGANTDVPFSSVLFRDILSVERKRARRGVFAIGNVYAK